MHTEDLSLIIRGFVVVLDHCYDLMGLCVRAGDRSNKCTSSSTWPEKLGVCVLIDEYG
jgi:hypothetical protein